MSLFSLHLIYWPVYVMCALAYLIGVATGIFCTIHYLKQALR